MTAELADLIRPLAGAEPAGPDLSYDAGRLEIERAFEAGSADDAAEPVDWRRVIALILEQAERTRDAWLPVYLARAGAWANRLDTVELGCEYLAGLFENCWETMHPGLADLGFQGRKGPCESLVRVREFVGPLSRVTLISHPRLGSFSVADVARIAGEGAAAEDYGSFRAALDELPAEDISGIRNRISRIRSAIQRIDAVLTEHADGDTGTNFAATYAVLDSAGHGLARILGDDSGSPSPAPVDEVNANQSSEQVRQTGSINSRDDVLRALDAISDYYRRREPGSPVPVAIARVKGWVDMDFLTILGDIAPESLAEVRRVLTPQREEP
ncbi:MAG: type VI secretion system ImpA family N-terminal domain-containing protein [Alphaproteobacteria bacterium]|nr:type VI secretion system ImpA family N-terminal domain-containing protein [Alphaproteobacteria bacterium]